MKNTIIAVLILLTIFVGGKVYNTTVDRTCKELENTILTCTQAVSQKDWAGADRKLSDLKNNWEEQKMFLSVFVHHSFLDTIQESLMRTHTACKSKNETLFQIECASLKEAIANLMHANKASFSNVF